MKAYEYKNVLLSHMIGGIDVTQWVIGWHLDAYKGNAKALQAWETGNASATDLQPGLLAILLKVKPEGTTATALAEIEELMNPDKTEQLPRDQNTHLQAAKWAIKRYEVIMAKKRLMERKEAEGLKDFDANGAPLDFGQ